MAYLRKTLPHYLRGSIFCSRGRGTMTARVLGLLAILGCAAVWCKGPCEQTFSVWTDGGVSLTTLTRRVAIAGTAAAASHFVIFHSASAKEPSLAPGVTILEVAENTAFQEDYFRKVLAGQADGFRVTGSMMKVSSDRLILNSKLPQQLDRLLRDLLPAAARIEGEIYSTTALRKLDIIGDLGKGKGDELLTDADVLRMANLYAEARNELRKLFVMLPAAVQEESKITIRGMRKAEAAQAAKAAAADKSSGA
ncbi:unnamed protein product [Polarella glacialis]|uniref:Uncharacterized protein n=1 Tax=Polarella glacialis TaxID=89957 RepID=A0A813LF48_POLGL|nr:unnamed protein product [Polarella glacialis]